MTRRKQLILSARQAALLASTPRLEIVEGFSALGTASARELAAHLGRPPGAVYHHVRTLLGSGLLVQVAQRPRPRRAEAVYALVADRLAIRAGGRTLEPYVLRTLEAVLRQAGRDAAAALARGRAGLRGRFQGGQLSAALGPSELRRVLALLARVEEVMRAANSRRGRKDEVFRWTSLLVPIRRGRA